MEYTPILEGFGKMFGKQDFIDFNVKGFKCTCGIHVLHSKTCQLNIARQAAAKNWERYIGSHPLTNRLIEKLKALEH